jgi:4'-phosphopantetheinyl transferase EntD
VLADRAPALLARIVPGGVCVAETFADVPEPLFPQEQAVIARAVATRRLEFRSARGCARQALAGLGLDRPPQVPTATGAPPWPDGVVGSMTHCAGYRAAAVAWASAWAGLGIDAEPHAPLPVGVIDLVVLPAEREQLAALDRTTPSRHWDRILFSAKESVYKVWSPLTGAWLGFDQARVTLDPQRQTFEVEMLIAAPAGRGVSMAGRWLVERGLVLTAALAAPPDR